MKVLSPAPAPAPLAVTIEEASRMMALSHWVIRRLIKEEKIYARKVGKRLLIPVSELQRFLDGDEHRKSA
jgi:excisionase family DNA binding protein